MPWEIRDPTSDFDFQAHEITPEVVPKVVIEGVPVGVNEDVNEGVNEGDNVSMEVDEGVNGHPNLGMNFTDVNMDLNESVAAKTVKGRIWDKVVGRWSSGEQVVVDVEAWVCSCWRWELIGIPCKHVFAVN
ncbi:hypothetical protein L1987_05540 [Smallanthus sonchifolius]|uniref:Uncharacterized protein n=1 Tax=Smallanthus sonchifolius TaxID=185202 RepID=A0ACB9JVR2_9ASTR|nr:hypothetical protein L1987_05540 [Smallanthus sonchifolius]